MTKHGNANIPAALLEAMASAASLVTLACGDLAVAAELFKRDESNRLGCACIADAYFQAAMNHVMHATHVLETAMQEMDEGPRSRASNGSRPVEPCQTSDGHPTEETLALFALGLVPQDQLAWVRGIGAHLRKCPNCRASVAHYRQRRLH
jgi:hypothetical protein